MNFLKSEKRYEKRGDCGKIRSRFLSFFIDSEGFLYYNLGRLPILAAKNFYEVNCDV